jgi:hypothetical protein
MNKDTNTREFKLLLICILNHLRYIKIDMINFLIISTDYNKGAINKDIEMKSIPYTIR